MDNQLLVVIKETGLEQAKTDIILQSYGSYYKDARDIIESNKELKVTSIEQVEEMQKARDARLKLRDIRVEADKTRKALKEQSLREGKAIQGVYNVIEALIAPAETFLLEQEKFAERIEAQKRLTIESERHTQLSKYTEDADLQSLHPDNLSQDSFVKLLETYKFAFEARQEAEKKAEEDRIAKEKADREEQERIRKENEQLKKEREEQEKQAKIEREKQEAILQAEREKREEVEAKLKAEQEAKEKKEREEFETAEAKRREEEETQKQALLAPDKEKLLLLANTIEAIELPAVLSKEAKDLLNEFEEAINNVVAIIRARSKKL